MFDENFVLLSVLYLLDGVKIVDRLLSVPLLYTKIIC
jgi:hypothetical protein